MSCDIQLQLCRSSRPLVSSIARQPVGHRHFTPLNTVQSCATSTFARLATRQNRSSCRAQPQQQQDVRLAPPVLPHRQSSFIKGRRAAALSVAAAAHEQPVAEAASGQASSSSGTPTKQSSSTSSGTKARQQKAASSSSSGSSSSSSDEGSSGPDISIKVLSEPSALTAVAKLRAEAYYEHDRSRFAASFKKQFAAQEEESLRQRTAPTTSAQRPQLCDCMVAVDSSGSVLGCIDIRLPESCTNMKTVGVPDGDGSGCYLLNVVVCERHRGMGVGKRVMRAAMARAVHHWGAQRLYTHVEADNEVANKLYRSCGFQEHSSEAKYANTSSLGRLVLLMATADNVKGQQQAASS